MNSAETLSWLVVACDRLAADALHSLPQFSRSRSTERYILSIGTVSRAHVGIVSSIDKTQAELSGHTMEAILQQHRPQCVIAVGLGSALAQPIPLGSVVVADQLAFRDRSTTEIPIRPSMCEFCTAHGVPFVSAWSAPWDDWQTAETVPPRVYDVAMPPLECAVQACETTSTPLIPVAAIAFHGVPTAEYRTVTGNRPRGWARRLGNLTGRFRQGRSALQAAWKTQQSVWNASDAAVQFVMETISSH